MCKWRLLRGRCRGLDDQLHDVANKIGQTKPNPPPSAATMMIDDDGGGGGGGGGGSVLAHARGIFCRRIDAGRSAEQVGCPRSGHVRRTRKTRFRCSHVRIYVLYGLDGRMDRGCTLKAVYGRYVHSLGA